MEEETVEVAGPAPVLEYTLRILEENGALGTGLWGAAHDEAGAHQMLAALWPEVQERAQGRCVVLLDGAGTIIAYLGKYPEVQK